jgi:hypothetical protein
MSSYFDFWLPFFLGSGLSMIYSRLRFLLWITIELIAEGFDMAILTTIVTLQRSGSSFVHRFLMWCRMWQHLEVRSVLSRNRV